MFSGKTKTGPGSLPAGLKFRSFQAKPSDGNDENRQRSIFLLLLNAIISSEVTLVTANKKTKHACTAAFSSYKIENTNFG